jgi:hypothetical protein
MFMSGIVVEDDVDRPASRDLALDGIEKANKGSSSHLTPRYDVGGMFAASGTIIMSNKVA